MNSSLYRISEIQDLEQKLKTEKDVRQRLLILDQLSSHFVYTNVQMAQSLLAELNKVLEYYPSSDIQVNYYCNKAHAENQLYNFLLAEINLSKAVDLLDEIGNAEQQIDAFIDYTGVLINLKKKDKAAAFLEKAAQILKSFPNPRLEARLICRQGFLELYEGNYEQAIAHFLSAEQKNLLHADKSNIKDMYFLTLIYSGLGNIYKEIEEKEKCLEAYLKVLDICKSNKMKTRLSWHYLNVGDAYMAVNEIDKAEYFLEKAIKIPEDISQSARAGASANLGRCYFLKGNYNKAQSYYDKAEKLYQEKAEKNYENFFHIESWRAELFRAKNKDGKTQKHLIKAFDYAKKIGDARILSVILKNIADYYEDIGEYENAHSYLKLHVMAKTRYYEEISEQKVRKMQIQFESEKRKQELELLALQTEKLQQKALRAQMNPHFMYNALNSIQRYIITNDADTASQFLARFAKLMRQSLEYSELESISLEREIEFLEHYLHINQQLRFDDLNYSITIDEEIEEDIMEIPTMIIQPYVENAIEHGLRTKKNAKLTIKFEYIDEETMLCIVEDNGIGRSGARKLQELETHYKNHQSRGTSITEQRLELLRNSHNRINLDVKTIDLVDEDSQSPSGTKILIKMPIINTILKKE